ncbi:CLUMA_CG002158, isoform A, partial [Clunio marinus]
TDLCSSRIQNAIAPNRNHVTSPLAPSQMMRQHLFLPQPVAGDCSSTDPVSDEGNVDVYAPVLKQLIPTRKNNHMMGSQRSSVDKREYIDIPLPKSVLKINLQNHENNCTKYNNYMIPTKNNLLKEHYTSSECICQTSDDKQDISSNSTYEDSLKGEFAEETTTTSTTRIALAQRTKLRQEMYDNLDRHANRHSFSGFRQMERNVKNSRRSSFMIGTNTDPNTI